MRPLRILLLYATAVLLSSCGGNPSEGSIGRSLKELDAAIGLRDDYDARKEYRIEGLREALRHAVTPEELYTRTRDLYLEFSSYQYDSAYTYVYRMQEIAAGLSDADRVAQAACDHIFCLLSAGLYKEAFDAAGLIEPSSLSEPALLNYYNVMVRLNYSAAGYAQSEPYVSNYRNEGARYIALLMDVLPSDSNLRREYYANLMMEEGRYEEGVRAFAELLKDPSADLHQRAIYSSSLGWMQQCLGLDDEAIVSISESAVCDIKSSTKETTALRMLADMMLRRGDYVRASRYIRFSQEDADFYGARLRKIEVGNVLPMIERSYSESLSRERNMLIIVLLCAVFLAVVALAAWWFIRRQNSRLKAARLIIDERNAELEEANRSLAEANDIKDGYIGNSFYVNAEYIEKMDSWYKMADRMIASGQYDLLRRTLRASATENERSRMYDAFDHTFLKIFPTFVNDYNALFPESEQQYPQSGLTSEMRIFALIRLGITESERIARFLDYSVHTINTYKTRVKNRSWVENERFETEIMKIGAR